MAGSGFDDHSRVVVLEFLVRKLVLGECLRAESPEKALEGWAAAMKAMAEQFKAAGFSSHKDALILNAIDIAGEFDTVMTHIRQDFEATHGR